MSLGNPFGMNQSVTFEPGDISSGISPLGITTAKDAIDASRGGTVSTGIGLGIASIILSIIGMATGVGMKVWQTKKQNEYNQQMLDQQNEYNSPIEQMKRLEAAGLNPMVMASNGGVGPGTSELGKKEAPDLSSSLNPQVLMGLLSSLSQFQVSQAQIRNLDASAALKTAQVMTESTKQSYYTSTAGKNNYWTNTLGPSQNRLALARAGYSEKELEFADRWIQSRIDLNVASKEQKDALVDRYRHLNNLSDQQIKESIERIALFQEQEKLCQARARLAYSQADVQDMKVITEFWDQLIKQQMLDLTGEKAQTWIPEKVADIVKKLTDAGVNVIQITKFLMMLFG